MSDPEPNMHIEGAVGNHNSGIAVGNDITQNIYYQHLPNEASFDVEAVEARYCAQVVKHYNKLALAGLPERDPSLHEITLEHVFVKLNVAIAAATDASAAYYEKAEALFDEIRTSRNDDPHSPYTATEAATDLRHLARQGMLPPTRETLSVADALQRAKRLAIIGGPGSGKTTLTRWLAVIFACKEQALAENLGDRFTTATLPILLELRRFVGRLSNLGQEPAVPDLATEIATFVASSAFYAETPADFILQALRDGRCLLILDGLDEIADLAVRQLLVQAIQAFLQHPTYQYRENLCLVTSRPHGYQSVSLGAGFQECEVKPFIPEDVKLFIKHWYDTAYGETAQDEAEALTTAIDTNKRIADLATNPLLCTIIAIVYRNNRVLPNRRVELYLKCCEALLDTWERNKAIKESGLIGGYDWQTKLDLLAPVAYWLHSEHERLAAPEEALVAQLAEVLQQKGLADAARAQQEARQFIATIRDRSGLLQGRGDGMLEFMHRTFQEYLTARFIATQPYPDYIDRVMVHLHEAWWQEVHLLVIGYLGSGESTAEKNTLLLTTILDSYHPPLRFLRAYYPRTLRFAALHRRVGRLLPRWQVERRLAWSLQRELALVTKGYLDCSPLGVTSPLRRRIATSKVTHFLFLQVTFGRVINAEILRGAASALKQLSTVAPTVIDALLNALADTDKSVRAGAVTALGQLGTASPAVIDALLHALTDTHSWVRNSAAAALGQLGMASPTVIDALLHALTDTHWPVRYSAATALGELGTVSPTVIDTLFHTLTDTEMVVSEAAASALGQLSTVAPTVIDALLHILTDTDTDENVRYFAVHALGQLDTASPAVINALLNALTDTHSWVRDSAATTLGKLDTAFPTLIDTLLHALTDTDKSVRYSAATALGRLSTASPAVIDALLHTLTDTDENIRYSAAIALGQLGTASPTVIDTLLNALTDTDENVREAAISIVVQLGIATPAVVDALLHALADTEWSVSDAAAHALAQLGTVSPTVIDALLNALTDTDENVRKAAARALGKLDTATPAVIDVLLNAIADTDKSVRYNTAIALGQLGAATPTVIDALLDALTDTDKSVRSGTASALGQLQLEEESDRRRILWQLNRRLHDSDNYVRSAALEAIQMLLDGRPLPGYHWHSLNTQQARRRKLYAISHWVILAVGLVFVAFGLTYLDSESRLMQVIAVLGGLLGIGAGLAQIVGGTLRNPWERK